MRRRIIDIAADLELLGNIPSVARQMVLILEVQTEEFWADVTPEGIEEVRRRLRDLVQLIEPRRRKIVITDFLDEIGEGVEVPTDPVGPGVDIGRFRMKVRRFLEQHMDHLAVQKLRRAQQLTGQDLLELERMLRDAGVEENRFGELAADGSLGVFLRSLIGLERTAAKDALSEAVRGHSLSADQVEFLNLIIDHLVDNGTVDPRRFYESPFTDIHEGGLGEVFPAELGRRIVETIRRIDQTAAA